MPNILITADAANALIRSLERRGAEYMDGYGRDCRLGHTHWGHRYCTAEEHTEVAFIQNDRTGLVMASVHVHTIQRGTVQ